MTKTELVAKLAQEAGIRKKQVDEVLCALVDTISASLLKNERIALPGLGSFTSVTRKARIGRNPRTGKEIKIPAKKAVKFSAAGSLGKGLNSPGGKKAPAKTGKKK